MPQKCTTNDEICSLHVHVDVGFLSISNLQEVHNALLGQIMDVTKAIHEAVDDSGFSEQAFSSSRICHQYRNSVNRWNRFGTLAGVIWISAAIWGPSLKPGAQ